MIKRGKSGISNIEMSIAIILFVLAVFSAVLIFNLSYKPASDKNALLENSEIRFMGYAQGYEKTGVKVSVPSNVDECFKIKLNSNLVALQENLSVYFNERKKFNLGGLENNELSILSRQTGYYEIYAFDFASSSDSERINRDCDELDITKYDYTIPIKGKIFLASRLEQIASEFSDTNIAIKDENNAQLFNTNKIPPKGAEVYAKTFFIKVFDNGLVKNAEVNLRVW